MKEDFVSFELALKLKEKGFDKFCENGYFLKSGIEYSIPNDDRVLVSSIGERIFNTECCWFGEEIEYGIDIIYAPIIFQVLKWLREEKNIEVVASFSYRNKVWGYQVGDMTLVEDSILSYDYSFPTYEQAALAGIEYVINNLI